jgi:hypothetical protein
MAQIIVKIRENLKKLKSCKRHNFGIFKPTSGALYNVRYTCKNCGGEMKLGDIWKYISGYEAGGGNSEDILRGLK